jgi:ApbE superfamily uncharacterized protein (UPF0280 family)
MSAPHAARLRDGRLHLQHGPIDLVIEAFGALHEVEAAYAQAFVRFGDILPTLVHELQALRTPLGIAHPLLQGPVARRMARAVWPHRAVYITPMAAVAGSVADEILAAMMVGRTLDKAYVNNGDLGLGRPLLFARHCRCGDSACERCSRCRCRGDHRGQCRRRRSSPDRA